MPMSFLQNSTLLPSIVHGSKTNRGYHQQIRTKGSIASLTRLVRNPIGSVGEVVENWYDGLTKEERAQKQYIEERKQILYLKLRNALNYDDWRGAATELDDIEGNNEWKTVFESMEFDADLVQARLNQLDEARISCDIGRMLFLVRTAFTRGLGDMGNLKLYKHTHFGTKDLIERYIITALATLDALLDVSAKAKCDLVESKHILEQMLSARQAFGRSALLLSGGGTFGMNHIGVLKALWETHLLPRIISGASAGSIVCAVMCTRTDEEMPDLFETFCYGDLAVFEEDGNEDTVLRKLARFLKYGALFDISHLTRVMKDLLGDMTFQEAYNRTRRILNICVSSASLYELPRLLNYVTAPNVLIWSAVAASCSVPFIFSAASLLAKDPRTGKAVPWNPSPLRWIDGSVDNDLPMTRLAEMFNVNHFIVSQVNPHVVPFLVKEEDSIAQEAQKSTSVAASGPSWLHSFSNLAKGEALHRMLVMAEMGILPNTLTKAVSVLSQKYSGDITILPEISYANFPRILTNPTTEFMIQSMLGGERATWPKMTRIRNHCAIELALDDAVQKLRARVVFSSSRVELRPMGMKSQAELRLTGTAAYHSEARKRDRKSGKRQRPLSLGNELDILQVDGIQHGDFRQRRRSDYPKSRDTNALSLFPSQSSMESFHAEVTESLEHLQHPLTALSLLSNPQNDVLSSEPESSHVATSGSESDPDSSSTDSPYPPSPKTLEKMSTNARHLFPYASNPSTPADRSDRLSLVMTPGPQREIARPSSQGNTKASSPETTYKRLFHRGVPRLQSKFPEPLPGSSSTGVKRLNAMGLQIDISGTRGMVMRKKCIESPHEYP